MIIRDHLSCMLMTRTSLLLGQLAVVLSLLATPMYAQCLRPGNDHGRLAMLAKNFETVYCVSGDFLNRADKYQGGDKNVFNILGTPLLPLLGSLGKMGIRDLVAYNKDLESVLVGAKEFTSPKELGLVHYDAYYEIAFSPSTAVKLRGRLKGKPHSTVGGMPVWKWTHAAEGHTWTFFIAQPGEHKVAVSTSKDLMRSLQQRSEGQQDSFLDSRPEWKAADLTRPVWAVRRYRHETTDPLAAGLSVGNEKVDPRAVGITLSFVPDERRLNLQYISPVPDDGPLRMWRRDRKVTVQKRGERVWSVSFPARGETSEDLLRLAICLTMFGFGVYI